MRILIVEDDPSLAAGLSGALSGPGFAVDLAQSGERADNMLKSEKYDLLVLDVGLPGIDGFEVLRRLRKRGQLLPVLILTARDEVEDRVHGLDLGADDYLLKPFAFPELEARVRALLRRAQSRSEQVLRLGKLVMNRKAQRAWIDDVPLALTAREWAVLEVLLSHAGDVLHKERIVQSISSWDDDISGGAIEVYISRLRTKLADASLRIRSIRGFGYLLEEQVDGSRQ
ncbi:MAG TPA: response regulator [Burkholderiales bacterium]|nr:response regulator [Burkholderiales bacterium]